MTAVGWIILSARDEQDAQRLKSGFHIEPALQRVNSTMLAVPPVCNVRDWRDWLFCAESAGWKMLSKGRDGRGNESSQREILVIGW
jgi:hypothetical protein